MKKILAFAGSNSSTSINQQLLQALAPYFEVEYELISLRDYEAPLFGVDLRRAEGVPDSIRQLHQKMVEADGLFISVAEHNGSMTVALKNTFDWLSILEKKFFLHKPTVFISTSPGSRGATSSLKHLVEIMPHRGAEIVGSMPIPNFSEVVNNGRIAPDVLEKLKVLIRTLESTVKNQS